jgi:hypothetical protein
VSDEAEREAKRPVAPALGPAGRQLWTEICSVYNLAPGELQVLREACRTADLISWLDDEIDGQYMTVRGSQNQPRVNPLIAAVLDARRCLDQLLNSLNLPFPADAGATGDPEVVKPFRKRRGDMNVG